MRKLIKILIAVSCLSVINGYADTSETMSPTEAKQFIKDALIYSMENRDPNMDYGKYMSEKMIKHGDGQTINFDQWVQRQREIKAAGTQRTPIFEIMIAEGDRVSAMYRVHVVNKDGTRSDIMDLEFFQIKDHKIIRVDELTRPIE